MSRILFQASCAIGFALAATAWIVPNGYCQDGDKRGKPGGTPGAKGGQPVRAPGVRFQAAANVLSEIASASDKGIPGELLEKAECVGVVPAIKRGSFVVGGKYGNGYVVCRTGGNLWSGPSAIRIQGGSFGVQIGGSETDLVFLVMTRQGKERLAQTKFTLGGDATAVAGPIGRAASADTDAWKHAELLTWSRSRGLFAGVTLEGATLRPDADENQKLYGHEISQKAILDGTVPPPKEALPLEQAVAAAVGRRR
jgi:SH3 domain-containing YSC84-like protein 1